MPVRPVSCKGQRVGGCVDELGGWIGLGGLGGVGWGGVAVEWSGVWMVTSGKWTWAGMVMVAWIGRYLRDWARCGYSFHAWLWVG